MYLGIGTPFRLKSFNSLALITTFLLPTIIFSV